MSCAICTCLEINEILAEKTLCTAFLCWLWVITQDTEVHYQTCVPLPGWGPHTSSSVTVTSQELARFLQQEIMALKSSLGHQYFRADRLGASCA